MEALAIDATALLEDQNQTFASRSGGLDIFGDVAECGGEPGLFMQSVITKLHGCCRTGQCKKCSGQNC